MSKEKKMDNKKNSTEDKWLTVFYGETRLHTIKKFAHGNIRILCHISQYREREREKVDFVFFSLWTN